MGLDWRPARRLLAAFLIVALASTWAAPAVLAAQPASQTGLTHALSGKLYQAFEKAARAVVARADRAENLDAEVRSLFRDRADRVFLDVGGKARIDLDRAPAFVREKLLKAKGYHLETNGCIAIDFMLSDVRQAAGQKCEVDFEMDVVLLLHPFLGQISRTAASTLGVLTLDLVAGRLIDCLEKLDVENLGTALAAGVKHATSSMAQQAGEETYELSQQFKGVSEVLRNGVSPLGICYCVGLAIVKGAAKSGLKYAGLTLGGAVGAALVPGIGAAIGTVIGSLAFVLIGQVVVNYVTADVPTKFRMWRIAKAHGKGDVELRDRIADKLVGLVVDESERQQFGTFDLIVGALQARKAQGESLEPFAGLVKEIQSRLQFLVLQQEDWNASRKYYQLKQVVDPQ
ncbi:MAG: hypothetical protein HY814_03515 [Candidatus Riflebacteria bacterium]|nr:hypothetical protein [Candidatus Riflebacteria bacterium]